MYRVHQLYMFQCAEYTGTSIQASTHTENLRLLISELGFLFIAAKILFLYVYKKSYDTGSGGAGDSQCMTGTHCVTVTKYNRQHCSCVLSMLCYITTVCCVADG